MNKTTIYEKYKVQMVQLGIKGWQLGRAGHVLKDCINFMRENTIPRDDYNKIVKNRDELRKEIIEIRKERNKYRDSLNIIQGNFNNNVGWKG